MQDETQQILKKVSDYRLASQNIRKEARKARAGKPLPLAAEVGELFEKAACQLEQAITLLAREIRSCRRQMAKVDRTEDICALLEAQSQTKGSLGGTWRDAGQLLTAIRYYEEGYAIEKERKELCKHKDSYNLLQRLVVRILHVPESTARDDSAVVEGVNVLQALDEARKEIEEQVFAGRDDSWALADLALVRFLCKQPAEDAIKDLKILEEQREKQKAALKKLDERKSDPSFYECTYQVVKALLNEGLGERTPLSTGLEEFASLLRRKGGLKD